MGFFSDAINKIRGVKEIEPKPKELDLSNLNLESFRSENWKNLEIRFTPNFWSGKDIVFVVNK